MHASRVAAFAGVYVIDQSGSSIEDIATSDTFNLLLRCVELLSLAKAIGVWKS